MMYIRLLVVWIRRMKHSSLHASYTKLAGRTVDRYTYVTIARLYILGQSELFWEWPVDCRLCAPRQYSHQQYPHSAVFSGSVLSGSVGSIFIIRSTVQWMLLMSKGRQWLFISDHRRQRVPCTGSCNWKRTVSQSPSSRSWNDQCRRDSRPQATAGTTAGCQMQGLGEVPWCCNMKASGGQNKEPKLYPLWNSQPVEFA